MVDNKTRVSSGGTANNSAINTSDLIATQIGPEMAELANRDDLPGAADLLFFIENELGEASGQIVRRNAAGAGSSRAQGTAGNSAGASTSKQNSTKAELEYVQIYCPRKDEWTVHHIGRKLARLACALYKDYVYVVSNNVSSCVLICG